MTILGNYPVDRTDFRLVRGVQNDILFFVRNLDRNPANTANFQTVTIHIIDPGSAILLMSRNLLTIDPAGGLYMLTILPSETADWLTGALRWSVSVTRLDNSTVMLWTDRNYGPFGMAEMSDGPIPGPAAPTVLDPTTFLQNNLVAYSPMLPGSAQLGYQNGLQTFAIYPAGFTGSVEIDASLAAQPTTDTDWFAISTTNYVFASTVDAISVTGSYVWLRVLVTTSPNLVPNANGSISQILYKR